MLIFQPRRPRVVYYKEYLHPSEEQYFMPGEGQVFIECEDCRIAPSIYYESSVEQHQKYAMYHGSNIYLASVLNSKAGIDKEINNLSKVASSHNVTVIMSNYIGESGGYEAAGRSSVWNNSGGVSGQLNEKDEGLLIYNFKSRVVRKVLVNE